MKISGFVRLEEIVQKLIWKHSVETEEVREIFLNSPRVRFIEKDIEKTKMFMRLMVKPTAADTWFVFSFINKITAP